MNNAYINEKYKSICDAIYSKNIEKIKILIPSHESFMEITNSKLPNILLYPEVISNDEISDYLLSIIDIDCMTSYRTNNPYLMPGDIDITVLAYTILGDNAGSPVYDDNYDYCHKLFSRTKNINKLHEKNYTILSMALFRLSGSWREMYINIHINIIKMLIDFGADPYIQAGDYGSSFCIATWICRGREIELLEILLNNKYNKYIPINVLWFVITRIRDRHIYDIIEFILPYIADINEPIFGNTILKHAHNEYRDKNIIELLEANGAF